MTKKGRPTTKFRLDGIVKQFEESAKWYSSRDFMNNDELSVAVRNACARTLLACAKDVRQIAAQYKKKPKRHTKR